MHSTLLTAATDIFVIAGAAAVATAAINSNKAHFRTSLGAERDDDSLPAAETNNAVGIPELQQSSLQKYAENDMKAPIVTVNEVAVTPPAAEMLEDDFFTDAKEA